MAALTIKQNDTFPAFTTALTDTNGPIDLTNASSVKVILKGRATATIIVGVCSIVSAVGGTVKYAWLAADTAIVDTYDVEFEIAWAAGGKQTVPNAAASNQQIEIDAQLDPPIG